MSKLVYHVEHMVKVLIRVLHFPIESHLCGCYHERERQQKAFPMLSGSPVLQWVLFFFPLFTLIKILIVLLFNSFSPATPHIHELLFFYFHLDYKETLKLMMLL